MAKPVTSSTCAAREAWDVDGIIKNIQAYMQALDDFWRLLAFSILNALQ